MNNLITLSFNDKLPIGFKEINVTSRGKDKFKNLSPFVTRPFIYENITVQNIENFWQFSKVYKEHIKNNEITSEYYTWRNNGWSDKFAHRYPMGKGKVPEFSLYKENRLDYIEARKQIYFPYYSNSVINSLEFIELKQLYLDGINLAIRDFDCFKLKDKSIEEVINDPSKKVGHGFVIYKMLKELK